MGLVGLELEFGLLPVAARLGGEFVCAMFGTLSLGALMLCCVLMRRCAASSGVAVYLVLFAWVVAVCVVAVCVGGNGAGLRKSALVVVLALVVLVLQVV